MRSVLPLLALVLLTSCEDMIGLGASCSGDMRSVRRTEGTPDETSRTSSGGDFAEQWIYLAAGGSSGRVYTFRWGLSYEACEVSGPHPLVGSGSIGDRNVLHVLPLDSRAAR